MPPWIARSLGKGHPTQQSLPNLRSSGRLAKCIGAQPTQCCLHDSRGTHKDHCDAAKATETDHGLAGGPPALALLLESPRVRIGRRQAKRKGHERHGSLPQQSGLLLLSYVGRGRRRG